MASTYTPLGVELMATGENAGTWGTKTNTNLQIFEQISGGYKVQTLNAAGTGANTTALAVSDGSTGATLATRVIILGAVSPETIAGNKIVTIPNDVENFYFIKNSTGGSGHTVQFKTETGGGTTFTWSTSQKDWRVLYSDGAGNIVEISLTTSPAGSTTQVQYNNSGAFGGDANLVWDASNGLVIGSQKELRLSDSSGGEYVGMKAASSATDYTLTWPGAVAGGNDYVLKSTTGGVLSWGEVAGGASWQSVITANPSPAVAGYGYFCNTSGGAFSVTLPASPSIGDFISFIDYAGTFDTNNLTVARNGKKIQGSAADLTVGTERAGFTLVFVDDTQGWLLQNNQELNDNLQCNKRKINQKDSRRSY